MRGYCVSRKHLDGKIYQYPKTQHALKAYLNHGWIKENLRTPGRLFLIKLFGVLVELIDWPRWSQLYKPKPGLIDNHWTIGRYQLRWWDRQMQMGKR